MAPSCDLSLEERLTQSHEHGQATAKHKQKLDNSVEN